MTLAFSYIRFSAKKQSDGHSLERQLKKAPKYAAANGLTLDPSSYRDLGVSAYKSKNVTEGALGLFLQAVDEKKIPKGSYLLVESIDRLSRDTVPTALRLLLSITERGINIVTLTDPPEVYSEKNIHENWTKLIVAVAIMARANEESALKSMRVKESWDDKVKNGKLAITKIPSWLKLNEKRTGFVVIKDRAAIINRLYDLILKGHTQREVAALFTEEKVAVLQYATRWTHSRVSHMLHNPAVYGTRPGPAGGDNYYPPIMTKKKAMMAQDIAHRRKWRGTQVKGQIKNLFAGIAWCSDCGSRMSYRPSSISHPYMHCTKASDDLACSNRLYPYKPSEAGLIYILSRKAGIDISGKYIAEQNAQEKALIAEIEKIKGQQAKVMKLATLTDGDIEVVALELRSLQQKLSKAQADLKGMNRQPITNDEVKEHRDLFDRYYFEVMEKQYEDGVVDVELRRQLKVGIARMVQRLEFARDKDGWSPLIYVTLIDGTRGIVKVSEYMTGHSLKIQKARHVKKRKRK